MSGIDDASVDLVVTSPPYPMIEMWDAMFAEQDSSIDGTLIENQPEQAFERMHRLLDSVWQECFRVMRPGGILCINIGDATRTIAKEFRLYPNHSRILQSCLSLGLRNLPNIIWRKQTNAPNKFMGSGMLPAGAYVTLEHEYILIFRKEGKRLFNSAEERLRRTQSAFFWEERNIWFSDVWDFKGIRQAFSGARRDRSAAFPFELAYRLINMYSLRHDTVLDPFLGTGTTMLAALSSERNSIGIDIDASFQLLLHDQMTRNPDSLNQVTGNRIRNHLTFIEGRKAEDKPVRYWNDFFGFPVMTMQERELQLHFLRECTKECSRWIGKYERLPLADILAERDSNQLALSL